MTGLTHSYQQLKLVDRAYQQCLARKPAGFWLTDESQENSWSAYLDVAGKGNRPYHRRDFEIDLFDVRVIRTEDQMCGFNLEYATVSVSRMNQTRICSQPLVDWPRVAQSYKGVIITPYQRTVMEQDAFRWYAGWDCASGCVWDLTCMRPVPRGSG